MPWTKTLLYWITLQIVRFLYLMMVFNGVSRCQMVSVGFRWCQGISNGVWECQAPTNPIWNLLKPPGTIQIIFSDFIDSMTLVTDCDLQCLMNIHICICSRKYQSECFYWSFIVNTNIFVIAFFSLKLNVFAFVFALFCQPEYICIPIWIC